MLKKIAEEEQQKKKAKKLTDDEEERKRGFEELAKLEAATKNRKEFREKQKKAELQANADEFEAELFGADADEEETKRRFAENDRLVARESRRKRREEGTSPVITSGCDALVFPQEVKEDNAHYCHKCGNTYTSDMQNFHVHRAYAHVDEGSDGDIPDKKEWAAESHWTAAELEGELFGADILKILPSSSSSSSTDKKGEDPIVSM